MGRINKPWWEVKHDWWIDDLRFENQQLNDFVLMLRMHPDLENELRNGFMEIIKNLKENIKVLRKEYKQIYGVFPSYTLYNLYK